MNVSSARPATWRAEVATALIICILLQFLFLLKISWDANKQMFAALPDLEDSTPDPLSGDSSDLPLSVLFYSFVADRFGASIPQSEQMNSLQAQQMVVLLPYIRACLIDGDTRSERLLRACLMSNPAQIRYCRQIWGSNANIPSDPKVLYDALDACVRSHCLLPPPDPDPLPDDEPAAAPGPRAQRHVPR